DFSLLLVTAAIGYSVEALSLAGTVTPLTLEPAAFTSVTYTMPASTLPVSTWVSTDFTSGCSVTGLTVIPAFLNTSAATSPHGTCGWHSATFTESSARSLTDSTFRRFAGGGRPPVFFSRNFGGRAAPPGPPPSPMSPGAAEATPPAGARLVICWASPELGPKLNFTVSPGGAAWNCLPSGVKLS